MAGKKSIDYALYLVTDSTPEILGSRDLVQVVEDAVAGGVTCVQLRDKTSSTEELIAVAKRLHEVTKRAGVPLLINDRVDVAAAVRCEGAHVGQDDTDLAEARRILGPDAIIGVSAGTVEEALRACEGGADYLGIGTVYATQTKKNSKVILGPGGVREILAAIAEGGYDIPTVCIGGINQSNVQFTLEQTVTSSGRTLDGVAVVSVIIAASDPARASSHLLATIRETARKTTAALGTPKFGTTSYVTQDVVKRVGELKPISHNMTNLVVQNIAANVALAIGASPIMSSYGEEAADLARLGGALVINMGTVTPEGLANHQKAIKAYNEAGRPVVYDPVGAGATAIRRAAVKTIMAAGHLDVIKGNEGEIKTVFGNDETQQRGVDSSSTLNAAQKAYLVRDLAAREGNIVVMTGETDYVSDGTAVVRVHNGHKFLGEVTGTGCSLGTTISAALAAYPESRLSAVVTAMLHYEIAAEVAAVRADVQGPGTFVPAFLDELYRIREATTGGDASWLERARVSDAFAR
ncbi:Hydroxyethylthiazole kinase family-domain-containing protein [Podospora aff. communis PSN243]|uniref:Hydroxyethylthiazole kinase family-domain-containing protein n=1 Tax=Podospora aff. communis PSN243 TaxID=3040156 RepID=A0AAV9H664_9PEZI|nr:Hydroxyethylthiazole kinase family-domain-containing protein [Podospora aff. communis PSN243]